MLQRFINSATIHASFENKLYSLGESKASLCFTPTSGINNNNSEMSQTGPGSHRRTHDSGLHKPPVRSFIHSLTHFHSHLASRGPESRRKNKQTRKRNKQQDRRRCKPHSTIPFYPLFHLSRFFLLLFFYFIPFLPLSCYFHGLLNSAFFFFFPLFPFILFLFCFPFLSLLSLSTYSFVLILLVPFLAFPPPSLLFFFVSFLLKMFSLLISLFSLFFPPLMRN